MTEEEKKRIDAFHKKNDQRLRQILVCMKTRLESRTIQIEIWKTSIKGIMIQILKYDLINQQPTEAVENPH